MELDIQIKLAKHIFRLIKVSEIVFPIGRTNKGNLGLKFTEGSNEFEIVLDSVPLSTKDMLKDDNNIELKEVLEKYWFEEPKDYSHILPMSKEMAQVVDNVIKDFPSKKKGGRPKGSKNKLKEHGKKPNKETA